jgi:hypothetical protein
VQEAPSLRRALLGKFPSQELWFSPGKLNRTSSPRDSRLGALDNDRSQSASAGNPAVSSGSITRGSPAQSGSPDSSGYPQRSGHKVEQKDLPHYDSMDRLSREPVHPWLPQEKKPPDIKVKQVLPSEPKKAQENSFIPRYSARVKSRPSSSSCQSDSDSDSGRQATH